MGFHLAIKFLKHLFNQQKLLSGKIWFWPYLKRYPVIFFKISRGISAFLGKSAASGNVANFLDNHATKIKSSSPQSIKCWRNLKANLAAQTQYSFQHEDHDKTWGSNFVEQGKLTKIVRKWMYWHTGVAIMCVPQRGLWVQQGAGSIFLLLSRGGEGGRRRQRWLDTDDIFPKWLCQ